MSEPAGADLPEARDGEGQLSKDALRAPAPGSAPRMHRTQSLVLVGFNEIQGLSVRRLF